MFCPLCKSEYREGFASCSDCHASLVAAQQEAKQVPVVKLWTGSDRRKFERILSALADANIPCRFEDFPQFTPHYRLNIFGFTFWKKHPDFQNDLKILIMQKDLKRARIAERDYFTRGDKVVEGEGTDERGQD